MGRNIPKSLATFVSSDADTARTNSNVQAAVQPMLDFYNKWFISKTNALQIKGSIIPSGSIVSSQGFKSTVATGTYVSTSYSGGLVQSQTTVGGGSASTTTPWLLPMEYSGSIVGLKTYFTGSTSCIQNITVQKNGVTLISFNSAVGGSGSRGRSVFAKGLYPFAAGDDLTVFYGFSVVGNMCIQGFMTLEMGA